MANSVPTTASTSSAAASPSIRTATTLIYALVAAVYVIQTILAIAAKNSLIAAYAKSAGIDAHTQIGRLQADGGTPAYVPTAIGSLVIFGGLLLLCAVFINRRANWARIVATVLAVLVALGLLTAVAQPSPAWYKLIQIVAGLLGIGIIVMLYRSDSNQFFRGEAAI